MRIGGGFVLINSPSPDLAAGLLLEALRRFTLIVPVLQFPLHVALTAFPSSPSFRGRGEIESSCMVLQGKKHSDSERPSRRSRPIEVTLFLFFSSSFSNFFFFSFSFFCLFFFFLLLLTEGKQNTEPYLFLCVASGVS